MEPITLGVITAIVIPSVAPTALDTIAAIRVALMNAAKGKPTWVVGTRFPAVHLASGNVLANVVIAAVSFKTVTLRTAFGYIDITKRRMLKLDIEREV